MKQILRIALRLAIFALPCVTIATPLAAQRFEGVITMRVSGNMQFMASGGGRGGGDARAGGRGGDATAFGGRGARGSGGFRANDRGAAGDSSVQTRGARGGGRAGGAMRGDSALAMQGGGSGAGRGGGRGNQSTEIEYMTRRGKVRVSMGQRTNTASIGSIIFLPDEGLIYTLIPAASMYMETSFADMAAADTMPIPATRREQIAAAPVVTHTKKFELIAEHRCEHVLVTIAKQTTDICIAKGLGTFVMPTGMGRLESWQKALNDANGFPLKVVQPNGTVAMEVTKVERKMLPESMFSIPETYTKMPDLRRPPG